MESGEGTIRILLVDAQSFLRPAVTEVQEEEYGLEVVAEADDVVEANMTAQRTHPDMVLLHADPDHGDLPSLIGRLRLSAPGCRVLILANDDRPGTIAEALEAGASGYLTKDVSIAELVRVAKSVSRGEVVIPPRMARALLPMLARRRGNRNEATERLSALTKRQREVLALLAEGADRDAISRNLLISPETARTHVRNIFAKLGVHSRFEATAIARRERRRPGPRRPTGMSAPRPSS